MKWQEAGQSVQRAPTKDVQAVPCSAAEAVQANIAPLQPQNTTLSTGISENSRSRRVRRASAAIVGRADGAANVHAIVARRLHHLHHHSLCLCCSDNLLSHYGGAVQRLLLLNPLPVAAVHVGRKVVAAGKCARRVWGLVG